MIREALEVGKTYAVLHGSMKDRSKARQFEITLIPTESGHDVFGFFTEERDMLVEPVSVRLIRGTWEDWTNGVEPKFKAYRRRDPADWLRRIAKDPDASPSLKAAATRQLKTLAA